MPYKSLNFWVFVTLDTCKENYYEDVFLEYSSSSFLKTKGKARVCTTAEVTLNYRFELRMIKLGDHTR